MKLKELNLISFGGFQNRTIDLADGLNIIYGENESGKTTIHSFIEGMFYGFLRPYAKIRVYTDEMNKYRPWNSQDYRGIMKLSQFGKNYRIERDFHKREVKIYDDLTGQDLTRQLDRGGKLKDPLAGEYFFDFNNTVYRNTISIKQLETRVEGDLSKEVKDKLANLTSSLDQDISVKNALGELDKKLEDIGSTQAYTKPLGRAIKELEGLKGQREELLVKKEEFNREIPISLELNKEIRVGREKIDRLKKGIDYLERRDREKAYKEALRIKGSLGNLHGKIVNLVKYEKLSFGDYELAVKLEKDREYLEKEISNIGEVLEGLKKDLKALELEENERIIGGVDIDELYKDLALLEEGEEEKNKLILTRKENKINLLDSQIKDRELGKNTRKRLMIFFLILTIATGGLSLVNILLLPLAIIFGILGFTFKNSTGKINLELEGLKEELTSLEIEERKREERIEAIENFHKELLGKYGCQSGLELKRLKEDLYFQYRNSKVRAGEIQEKRKQLSAYRLRLEEEENKLKASKEKIASLLEANLSKDLEDFKLGLDRKRKYQDYMLEKEKQKEILNRILGDASWEDFKKDIEKETIGQPREIGGMEGLDRLDLREDLARSQEALQKHLDKQARLEERMNNLNQYIKELIVVEEEIERLKKKILAYENKVQSIKLARETIESISRKLHEEFAPTINRDISKLVSLVTAGRYREVKIDEGLNISIENPSSGEIIPLDSLSGGTIDQLYFALRFTIITSIKKEAIPIILDDCFIQYDDLRLREILKYLANIARDRQIILFTCQQREKTILRDLGLGYKLINL